MHRQLLVWSSDIRRCRNLHNHWLDYRECWLRIGDVLRSIVHHYGDVSDVDNRPGVIHLELLGQCNASDHYIDSVGWSRNQDVLEFDDVSVHDQFIVGRGDFR